MPNQPKLPRSKSKYHLRRYAEETLGEGSLRKVTTLPEGEDLDEWLSVNGNVICILVWESREANSKVTD